MEKQRWEESEKRREEERRSEKRKSQKKEDAGARKGSKVVFLQCFVAPEGRKVGSLKRRVRSHLARWEMNNCTPLWREAHFQVKMHKARQLRSTLRNGNVEKVHAVVERTHFEVNMCKTHHVRSTFGSWDVEKVHVEVEISKKCTPLWREARFQKHYMFGPLLDVQVVSRGKRSGLCTLSKISKMWGFCGISKNDLQRCISRGRRSTRDMSIRGRSDFLRGVAFWSIRSSGLLRWFCVTGAALRMTRLHFFVAGAVLYTDGMENSQYTLVRGGQFTQLSIFAGGLAELLRFWCCQLQKFRKPRRIASFLTLSSSKAEAVSQNCVFDVVKFKNWGSLAELLCFQACR